MPGQTGGSWLLPNFSDRLEVTVSNPSDVPVETVAVLPVAEAARAALGFPGTLAIVVEPSGEHNIFPSQADDLDGDGVPDEFVFPVKLGAREERVVHVYYSMTLREQLPWPKRVHASHAFGYNRSTAALESEAIGYRTYGGFSLDVQARWRGRPGLNNSLLGYFGSGNPQVAGMDILHVGDTLGLGGLFLRSGTEVYRPPLNMPDWAGAANGRWWRRRSRSTGKARGWAVSGGGGGTGQRDRHPLERELHTRPRPADCRGDPKGGAAVRERGGKPVV